MRDVLRYFQQEEVYPEDVHKRLGRSISKKEERKRVLQD